jgi:hypothetical protein
MADDGEPKWPVPQSRAEGHEQRIERADRANFAAFVSGRRVAEVRAQTGRGEVETYSVLVGARLCPVPVGDDDPDGRKTDIRIPAVTAGGVQFQSVSTASDLGPPYTVAIACTCLDWRYRSGLDPYRKDAMYPLSGRERDAGIGCKHMMICNQELLAAQPGQLGAPARDRKERDEFLEAGTSELGAYANIGPLTPL